MGSRKKPRSWAFPASRCAIMVGPETVTIGTNELHWDRPRKLPPALTRLMAGQWKSGGIPPLWDGKAAERIVGHLSVCWRAVEENHP